MGNLGKKKFEKWLQFFKIKYLSTTYLRKKNYCGTKCGRLHK